MAAVSYRTLREWVNHWVKHLSAIGLGEEVAEPQSIPLAAYRALVALADQIEVPANESAK
jgi:hypothetical protein